MATTSVQNFANPYVARTLCRIVGLTCLAGFAIDMLALALPPDIFSLEWRINVLQQVSDRSIVLLIGVALTLYGSLDAPRVLRQLAITCLVIGIMLQLSCILYLRDSATLHQQTVSYISSQANQLQTRIQEQSNNPTAGTVTAEQLQQASRAINTQAETLKQSTRTGITKAGLASMGNLIVMGLGMISLGRYASKYR